MKRRTTKKTLRRVERELAAEVRAYIANIEDFEAAECPHLIWNLQEVLGLQLRLERSLAACWGDELGEFEIEIAGPGRVRVWGTFWWLAHPIEGPSLCTPFEGELQLRRGVRRPLEYTLRVGEDIPASEMALLEER